MAAGAVTHSEPNQRNRDKAPRKPKSVDEASPGNSLQVGAAASLAGRSALVTGGGSGIGLAIARCLSQQGAAVTIADIKPPPASDEALTYVKADVRDPAASERLSERLTSEQSPDLLILNAGRGVHERLAEGDPEIWREVFELNVMGALRMIRAFTHPMLERENGGDVVIISSVAAMRPYEYGGVYAASKAALNTIAETLRLEVQPRVRVLTVIPGVVETGFFDNMAGGNAAGLSVESIGWGALEPDDVAEAVLWALTRPRRLAVNEIVLRPVAQKL